MSTSIDQRTADAFADSWNNLPLGSVYTKDQFDDWISPLTESDIRGRSVLELACGGGSILVHLANLNPSSLVGVDLGSSVETAKKNLATTGYSGWSVVKGDLTQYRGAEADVVFCIGALHHLKDPKQGLDSVIRNTKPGGRFHCWVYAEEGNAIVIWIVDPIRKLACQLPWWITKFLIATPLAFFYFLYAKALSQAPRWNLLKRFPLYEYSLWIARRDFSFFQHVAFDQLVTPQTVYIPRTTIQAWMKSYPEVDVASVYILQRNGNSWKFGGRRVL
jgi:ubiquinone/menaquinone biosynthesis C-methylase UbiE